MSAIAWYAGEDWSDKPACVCPVLRHMAIAANDMLLDDRTRERLIGPVLFEVVGTNDPDRRKHRAEALLQFGREKARSWRLPYVVRAISGAETELNDDCPVHAVRCLASALDALAMRYGSTDLATELIELIVKLAREGTREEVPQVRKLEELPV